MLHEQALAKEMARLDRRARALPAADESKDFDPLKVQRIAEGALEQLRTAEKDDPRALHELEQPPEVCRVPRAQQLTWVTLLSALLARSYNSAAKPGARKVLPAAISHSPTPLQEAIEAAESVRKRVVQIVDGLGVDQERSAALREAVLGDRTPTNTRPSWEVELNAIIASIRNMKEDAPPALEAILVRLEIVRDQLTAAPAQPGGRPRAERVVWSEEVLHDTTTLHLALEELLGWSAAVATNRRHAALSRVLTAKRRSEAPAEPSEAAPAKPATAVPLPGPVASGSGVPAPGPAAASTAVPAAASTAVAPAAPAPASANAQASPTPAPATPPAAAPAQKS